MFDWQPTASLEAIRLRAQVLQQIRQFFAEREVLEVETPLLCHGVATDPFIQGITIDYPRVPGSLYLQTSPEYAMKRLLAAGSGSIYQVCKAFRAEECGPHHNPEFLMLEWYRLQFDHLDLMQEVDELLQLILGTPPALRLSYQAVFEEWLQFDPHTVTVSTLQAIAQRQGIQVQGPVVEWGRDDWCDLLFTHVIQDRFAQDLPYIIYDYPASQAALARIRAGTPPVAERFEVYFKGLELANGYHELTDAQQQAVRFQADCAVRRQKGLLVPPIDERLLAALRAGLPDCAGVALGLDRLIMLKGQYQHIDAVLSFPLDRA